MVVPPPRERERATLNVDPVDTWIAIVPSNSEEGLEYLVMLALIPEDQGSQGAQVGSRRLLWCCSCESWSRQGRFHRNDLGKACSHVRHEVATWRKKLAA